MKHFSNKHHAPSASQPRLTRLKKNLQGRGVVKILGLTALLALGYCSLQSPQLQFASIEVNGLERTPRDQVLAFLQKYLETRHARIFPEKSLFIFSASRAEVALSEEFILEAASCEERFFTRTLVCTIQDSVPAIVLQTPSEQVLISRRGMILALQPKPSQEGQNTMGMDTPQIHLGDFTASSKTPLLAVSSSQPLNAQEMEKHAKIFSDTLISFLQKVEADIGEGTGLQATSFALMAEHQSDIATMTSAGFAVYFDSRHDVGRQLELLRTVMKEKVQKGTRPTQYIDLRDENGTVYIK